MMPAFVCSQPGDLAALAARGFPAIPAGSWNVGELRAYRGQPVRVLQHDREAARGACAVLRALSCDVGVFARPVDVANDDLLAEPVVPMFTTASDAPDQATSDDPGADDGEYHGPDDDAPAADSGVRVGGALTMAATVPDPEFVLAPLFIRGKFGAMTAHPGAGKTTFMVGACAALALDRAFGPLTPESDGLVYIVSAEDVAGTRNRIFAEAARMRLTSAERDRLDARLRWVHAECSSSVRAISEAIERDAGDRDIALVFVDTGPALFPGDDENANVEMRNFVEGLRKLTTLPGEPCVVAAWHPSKGATADRIEPRGASSIKGTVDFALTLWREDDALTLHFTKFRGPAFEPIEGTLSVVDLESPTGARTSAPVVTLAAVGDEIGDRSDARRAREAILSRLLSASGPLTVRDVAKGAGVGKSAAGRHLAHLAAVKPALVEKDAITERYGLTKQGEVRAREIADQGGAYARAKG